MKYLRIIENMANDLEFNGFGSKIIIIMFVIGAIIIYIYNWLNSSHKHEISQTIEEYYQHIKEEHPDIWEEYNLTDEGIKEFIKKLRDNENES